MPELDNSVFVAEGAHIIGDVTIGADSSVWYNAVIRGDQNSIDIGERTNIQDNVVIHIDDGYPVKIGNDVTIGHGAIVHGCTIGNNTLIGMGAIILNGAVIGDNCIIGAGALVTYGAEIPTGSVAYGLPAQVAHEITPEQIEGNRANAAIYVNMAREARTEDLIEAIIPGA